MNVPYNWREKIINSWVEAVTNHGLDKQFSFLKALSTQSKSILDKKENKSVSAGTVSKNRSKFVSISRINLLTLFINLNIVDA